MQQSILLLGALLLFALPARAVDMFLKLTDIPGESVDATHKDEIEILSYSFGMSNTSTISSGGTGAGKAVFQDISLAKRLDKSTPALMLKCANGQHIPEAVITLRKGVAGAKPVDYLRITLTDVIVSSVTSSASDGGGVPNESISFNYGKIKVEYFQQLGDGSVIPAGVFAWSVVTATQP